MSLVFDGYDEEFQDTAAGVGRLIARMRDETSATRRTTLAEAEAEPARAAETLQQMELEHKSHAAIKGVRKWLIRRQARALNTWCAMVLSMQRADDMCRKVMRKMMAANLHAGFR